MASWYGNLSALFCNEGRLDESLAAAEQAARLQPEAASHHLEVGLTCLAMGRHEAAANAFLAAIRREEEDANLHMALGELLLALGKYRPGWSSTSGATGSSRRAAAGREGVHATVIYTKPTGPLKNRHTRVLAEEARSNKLSLVRTKKIPLHGKFVAWDADDVVITSLNWASASGDPDFRGAISACMCV